jgi:hypothetical protein
MPSILYRYRPMSENLLAEIEFNSVYFCPLNKLNDSLEGTFDFKSSDLDQFRKILIERAYEEQEPEHAARLESMSEKELHMWHRYAKKRARPYVAARDAAGRYRWGVACFTERLNNLRMWDEYASQRQGVVLEFDLSQVKIPEGAFRKVKYTEQRGSITVNDALRPNADGQFFEALTYKKPRWAYEEEWRLLFDRPVSAAITVPIARVILGPEMSNDDKNKVVNALVRNGFPGQAELIPTANPNCFILKDRVTGDQKITLV